MTSPLPQQKLNRWLIVPLLILIALLPAVGLTVMLMPGPLKENTTVIIPHGIGAHEIATLLDKNDVIWSPLAFRLAAKIIGSGQLKAGEYEFTQRQNTTDVMQMMIEGRSVVHLFTVAEGLTSAEILNLLNLSPALIGNIMPPPEGSLLPETYRYSYGDSRASMVTRMQKAMQDTLSDLWAKRDVAIPLQSPQQAVVMASIIEKETGKTTERPRIAGVFYNRLRQNMRLQSDPTVIYAIARVKGPMDRDLEHDDLMFPSPYNTYMSDGLPPQPICNPGRAALEAALHPEPNDFLYFVADGTGGHVFSKDLTAHNQNVVKWINLKKSLLK